MKVTSGVFNRKKQGDKPTITTLQAWDWAWKPWGKAFLLWLELCLNPTAFCPVWSYFKNMLYIYKCSFTHA